MSVDPYPSDTRPAVRTARSSRPPATWWPALRRTPVSLWNDDISDFAAALTYYAINDKPAAMAQYETLKGLDVEMARQLYDAIKH